MTRIPSQARQKGQNMLSSPPSIFSVLEVGEVQVIPHTGEMTLLPAK